MVLYSPAHYVHPRALACILGVKYQRSSGLGYVLRQAARINRFASACGVANGTRGAKEGSGGVRT